MPNPPAGLDSDQFKMWLDHQEKARNQRFGLVVVFGVMLIVAATAILLVWSPWN